MWDQYFKQDSDERRIMNEEIEKLKTEKTSLMVCITVCALAQNLLLQDFGFRYKPVHMPLYFPANRRLFWRVCLVHCRHSSRKASHFGGGRPSTGVQIVSSAKAHLCCHLGLFLPWDFAAIGPYLQVLSVTRYEANMPAHLARP